MREIKFRVWSNDLNRMVYPDEKGWFQNCFIGDNQFYQTCSLGVAVDKNGKELELLQYTGLKDKNGKEIYEGDIIRTIALSNDHHQMGATSVVTVKYFVGNPSLCEIGYETGIAIYPFCVSHTLEIIGNIHENPELLKS